MCPSMKQEFAKYAVTYVPVLVNVPENSPDERNLAEKAAQYAVTYVPVLVNLAASSPDEQELNHHSAPLPVVSPQQHSVHPTGHNNPGLPSEEFLSAYAAAGTPYYTGQAMCNQSPFTTVPPMQQAPPATRDMKTVRVRDPDQGKKDVTEEIILDVARSQNPTLPAGRPSSSPTHPLLNQVVEHEHVIYNVERAKVLHSPVHWKPDGRYPLKRTALKTAGKPTSLVETVSPHGDSALVRADKPEPAGEYGKWEAELLKKESKLGSEDVSEDGILTLAEEVSGDTAARVKNAILQYSRDFLLSLQFNPACMQKPEDLPPILDIVLEKLPNTTLKTPQSDKIIPTEPVNEQVQLKKAENAWKPCMKRGNSPEDPEAQKTQELFRRVRSILNKLTPQMFNQLMKQVKELTIDTEERLKGVIDLVFEKAIDEPNFAVGYGIMCKCLATLQVPMADNPNSTVNFRRLLLNRCQKEFERDKMTNDVIEKKQQKLEALISATERYRLQEELQEAKCKFRKRTTGNVKFVGELFKLRMLNEPTMHDCLGKLLKNKDEESLECFTILLTTVGKELDHEKSKPQMDLYMKQIEQIIKERKTSLRVRFMLQDVTDLRLRDWVSRRAEQGPKTIEQIHIDAKIKELEEQLKVHELLRSKARKRPGHGVNSREDTPNPVAKNTATEPPNATPQINKLATDDSGCLGGEQPNWVNGFSGESVGKSDILLPSHVKCHSPPPVPSCSSANVPDTPEPQPDTASMSKPASIADSTTDTSALSKEKMEKRSQYIIHEFIHLKDYKEASECLEELDQATMHDVFVRVGVEIALERSHVVRDHMGQLFHQLLQAGRLSKSEFFKGFSETLEVAVDMAIDIPYIWLYIAELVNPVLREGSISLRELFSEFSKPLLPVARAGILFSEIMHLLCKQMSQNKVEALWRDSGLSWADFLPETEDVHSFITEQKLDFTLSDGHE